MKLLILKLIRRKTADRPLYGLKKFSTTIAIHINDLPTTSPHGSYSDTMQKIRECQLDPRETCGTATARRKSAATSRATDSITPWVPSPLRNNGVSDKV